MTMNQHRFELTAHWQGGRLGEGRITAGQLSEPISIPAQLQGPGKGTNPEEMLLGAAATCYLITLAAILERLGIDQLSLTSEAIVSSSPSMKVEAIIHRPIIQLLTQSVDETQIEKVKQAALRAEQTCMISKALKGNVEIRVEPVVQIG
jgi:peroxiredoxin-like protein